MNQTIKQKVYRIVSATLDVPVADISEDTSPDTLQKWDSLKHMNLILSLEDEFGVEFTDEQTLEMQNVALIVMTLEEALADF
ncbi:MAG: acyl carrier protein [Chloroflexi bacterium]|nr:acyl carrier protein [Chloroflexota bacterium]